MSEYTVVDQTDLDIYFDWEEDLANYTAELHYYLQTSGTSSSTSVISTVTTVTTSLSYTYYSLRPTSEIFNAEGLWVVHAEVTSSTSRWRACEPVFIEFRQKGQA